MIANKWATFFFLDPTKLFIVSPKTFCLRLADVIVFCINFFWGKICVLIICRKILIIRIDLHSVLTKTGCCSWAPFPRVRAFFISILVHLNKKIEFLFRFFFASCAVFCNLSHSLSFFILLHTQCLHRSKFSHSPSLDSM